MLHSDVVFAATKMSMTHTQAMMDAWKSGKARTASIPIQNDDHELVVKTFATGGMTADYVYMDRQIGRLLGRLKHAGEARVTSDIGTDIRFTFHGRPWRGDSLGAGRTPSRHAGGERLGPAARSLGKRRRPAPAAAPARPA